MAAELKQYQASIRGARQEFGDAKREIARLKTQMGDKDRQNSQLAGRVAELEGQVKACFDVAPHETQG